MPDDLRSGFARVAAGLVAAAVPVTLHMLAFPATETVPRSSPDEALRVGVLLAPWVLTLPWLKKLDLRPVPWFFGCLAVGVVAGPLLVFTVVFRATLLPYRDWASQHWHEHRTRRIVGTRLHVLLPAGAVPAPVDPEWLRRTEVVQRGLWAFYLVLVPAMMIFDLRAPTWLGLVVYLGLIALMLSHVVVAALLSPRRLRRTPRRPA